jgi:prefoldin subunit 5
MMNRDEEYNRLHDHCQALGRERDQANSRIAELEKRINDLDAVLKLAQALLGLD